MKGIRMWYIIQAAITIYLGYIWTTMPGNSPGDIGHGIWLGGFIAWFTTLTCTSIYDSIKKWRAKRTTCSDKRQDVVVHQVKKPALPGASSTNVPKLLDRRKS